MKANDDGAFYSVHISANDVFEFMIRWPCSGLTGRHIWAQFDKKNGDLVDLHHSPHDEDGPALLAIINDGRAYAEKVLRIDEIRTPRLTYRRVDSAEYASICHNTIEIHKSGAGAYRAMLDDQLLPGNPAYASADAAKLAAERCLLEMARTIVDTLKPKRKS